MDYDKMYFPKTEMLQLVPPPVNNTQLISPDDTYSAYADNFDLSLLPNETELPLSPQSDFSSSSSLSLSPSASVSASSSPSSASASASATPSATASSPAQVSLDYIPTTIYHDSTVTQIKTEKPWSDDTTPAIPHQQRLPLHSSTTLNRTSSFLYEQLHHHYKLYPSPQPSPSSQDHFHHNNGPAANYPPSPCPSIDAKHHHHHQHHQPQPHQIKQEYHILPPSPPESSCGAPSPHSFADIKQEPDEALIDINSLLENSLRHDPTNGGTTAESKPQQDHQLLREYLEDTTFQKKHNLKPLALESLIGGLGVRSDIEPVISLALEHAKREAEETCTKLQISADPQKWTPTQVHAWLRSTVEQFKLPPINDLELKFPEDGTTLSLLTEEEFVRRAPEAGGTIHAQLEIWKLACSDNFPNDFNANPTHNNNNNSSNSTSNPSVTSPTIPTSNIWSPECIQNMDMDVSDEEDEEILPPGTVNSSPAMASTTVTTGGTSSSATPSGGVKPPTGRTGGSHIHLWQFLKELLATPHLHGTAIRWIDRSKGVFKIEDSVRVAKLWGRRKNRPAMNYDKLSRSIRQYYKKGIMKKTERSQRLVYQFCHPYSL